MIIRALYICMVLVSLVNIQQVESKDMLLSSLWFHAQDSTFQTRREYHYSIEDSSPVFL